ncbi:MAG: hypothetical protein WBJ81_02140 [Rickettsiales bacterium]
MTKRPLDNNEEPKENKKQRIEQSSSDSENDSQEELLQIISQLRAENSALKTEKLELSEFTAYPGISITQAIINNDIKKLKYYLELRSFDRLEFYDWDNQGEEAGKNLRDSGYFCIKKENIDELSSLKCFKELKKLINNGFFEIINNMDYEIHLLNVAAQLGHVEILKLLLDSNFSYAGEDSLDNIFISACNAEKNAFKVFNLLINKIGLTLVGGNFYDHTIVIEHAASINNPSIQDEDYRIVDYLLKLYLNHQETHLLSSLEENEDYNCDAIIKTRLAIVIKDYIRKGTEASLLSESESDSDNNYNEIIKDAIAKAKVIIEKEIEIAFKKPTIIPKILDRYGDNKALIFEFLGITGSISLIKLENSARQPIIRNILAKEGLTYFDVDSDGNCFYHAVSRQLSFLDTRASHIEVSHEALRDRAVNEIRTHQNEYMNVFGSQDAMDTYINTHSREGTWAEGPIIDALSNMLQREYNVALEIRHYNPNTRTLITMPTPDGNGQVIRVLHNLVHYQSIERLNEGKNEDSSNQSQIREDDEEDQGSSSQSELSEDEEISGHHIDQVYNTEENPNYTNEQETSFNNTASNYTNLPISSEPLNDDNVDWALAALITGSVSDDSINPSF